MLFKHLKLLCIIRDGKSCNNKAKGSNIDVNLNGNYNISGTTSNLNIAVDFVVGEFSEISQNGLEIIQSVNNSNYNISGTVINIWMTTTLLIILIILIIITIH